MKAEPRRRADALVLALEATNLPDEQAEAFQVLFNDSYRHARGKTVLAIRAPRRDTERPAALLDETGATEYFEGSLVGLDKRIIVALTRFDRTGRLRQTHKMTASGLDDFDVVATRMAEAFAMDASVDDTRGFDTVTAAEGHSPNRVERERIAALRGGVVVPFAEMALSPMVAAHVDIRNESRSNFVGFGFGLLLPAATSAARPGYGGATAEVGTGYYLTRGNTGVYVGGGLMARALSAGANVAPFATFGTLLDRDANAHFIAELRVGWNATPLELEREDQGAFDSTTEVVELHPLETSLNASVAW